MKIKTDYLDNIQRFPDNINLDKLNYKMDYSTLNNLKQLDNVPDAYISNINGTTCIFDGQYKIIAS